MIVRVPEIERKYQAPLRGGTPDLRDVPGVAAAVGPERELLEATYFDTADLRLARAGVTLRRRTGGHDPGWHLKLPAGPDSPDSKQEVRVPLGRSERTPPEELTELVLAHTRSAPLVPVGLIRTERDRWLLRDDSGGLLAEVADDQVTASSMGESSTVDSWREVEVELGERGSPKLWRRLESRLARAGARPADAPSKLARLLADRLPAGREPSEPGDLGRDSSTADVVLHHLRGQVERLLRLDPRVRQDAPDAVHQMRVTARRLRSALKGFRSVLRADQVRLLNEDLRWLGRVLGDARDLEVLHHRISVALAGQPPELVIGPVSATLTRYFAGREAEARDRALAVLRSARYFTLLDRLTELLDQPPLRPAADRPARKVLRRDLRHALRVVRRRARRARAGGGDDALHDVRKAAKRLRYLAEAAEPVLGKRARKVRRRAKAVQQTLGEHVDTVVARSALRLLGVGARTADDNGFTFGLLHGVEGMRAAEARDRWAREWQALDGASV